MSDYWTDESARMRKTVENELMRAVGLPMPHPEHDDELRRRREEHQRKRAQWVADRQDLDVVERLSTLDERLDLDDPYADHDIQDAVAEISRLRAQVAELLPLAEATAQRWAKMSEKSRIAAPYRAQAIGLLARIDAGEFGEAQS